jgi:adenylate cyclase
MAKINNNNHEIERRWLTPVIPKEIGGISKLKFTDIIQTYISKKPVIRLRSHDKKEFVLCIKTQGDKNSLARPEQETKITKKEYTSLLKISKTEPIIKRRYFFKYKKHKVELDVFDGYLRGLIIIELEFKSESDALSFEPPEWFGKEITGMKKYANSSLAKLKQI